MRPIPVILAIALAGLLSGCVTIEEQLKKRAAFDLDCPQNEIEITEIEYYATYGVTGCQTRATYLHSPNGTWVLNSVKQDDETPQPAPRSTGAAQ